MLRGDRLNLNTGKIKRITYLSLTCNATREFLITADLNFLQKMVGYVGNVSNLTNYSKFSIIISVLLSAIKQKLYDCY